MVLGQTKRDATTCIIVVFQEGYWNFKGWDFYPALFLFIIKNPLSEEKGDKVLNSFILDNQHRISIAEETILILNSFFISFHHQIVSCKRTCHNQQAGFRQMKVSNQ